MKEYTLLQDYKTPCRTIYKGVTKPESEWVKLIPELAFGDCGIKKDWFALVPKVNLPTEIIYPQFSVYNRFCYGCIAHNKELMLTISEDNKWVDVFLTTAQAAKLSQDLLEKLK